jgi:hypothetical protein
VQRRVGYNPAHPEGTMNVRVGIFSAVLLITPLAAQSVAPAIDSIRQDDLKADLYFLASDAMKGRLTNTPENLVASEWIKSRFQRLGLKPAGPGYFQDYDLMTVTLGSPNEFEILEGGAGSPIAHAQGFTTQRFSATAKARGAVVFAGYGIRTSDPAHDDYRDAALVKGAVVLVLDHEPGERDRRARSTAW